MHPRAEICNCCRCSPTHRPLESLPICQPPVNPLASWRALLYWLEATTPCSPGWWVPSRPRSSVHHLNHKAGPPHDLLSQSGACLYRCPNLEFLTDGGAAAAAAVHAAAAAAAAVAADLAGPCTPTAALVALPQTEPLPATVEAEVAAAAEVPLPPLASAPKRPLTDLEASAVAGEALATAAAAMLARLEVASCCTDDMEQEDDLTANSPVRSVSQVRRIPS
mmetsp:Transcript_44209/g.116998  ORF Transcript_44209/g.116998 Transcript_44209/m.116998 type:complete len:222 (-) Transcript_44209:43-708(-)